MKVTSARKDPCRVSPLSPQWPAGSLANLAQGASSLVPTNTIVKTVELTLPYPPSTGNHSVRHGSRGSYVTKEAKEYRALVLWRLASRHAPDGPISTAWTFYPPDKRRRDADNLMKVVGDALTLAGFWKDDSNEVIVAGSWDWGPVVKGGVIELVVRTASVN